MAFIRCATGTPFSWLCENGGALVTVDQATSSSPRTDLNQSESPLSPKSILIDFINTRSDYKVRFLWSFSSSPYLWCSGVYCGFYKFDQINKCILCILLSLSSRTQQGVLSYLLHFLSLFMSGIFLHHQFKLFITLLGDYATWKHILLPNFFTHNMCR